ncbi:MAG: pyruvate formate-lyase-activating protein [Acetivibrionales bacterium]|jgi:pyruvate formate lyase activating enzyme|nr:pyruvate formate lyase-activating protein [Clostridiaceae bacterium]
MEGYIHSVETYGTLDGPGIRYVVFMQGCALRCKYCHNPDTWQLQAGNKTTVQELMEDILKYKNFIKSGGVTLSGGEPLLQPDYAAEVLKECRKHGIHTAIDTSGELPLITCRHAIDEADLVLLDIKSIDSAKALCFTGKGNENVLRLLDYLEESKKEVWIRHVIVPGLTDDYEDIEKLAEHLSHYTVISRVDILPFHKLGEYKWEELGLMYELGSTQPPEKESIAKIKTIFRKYKLNVV